MTTIYKATPGEPEINISYMSQNIRFTGNDVKTINIDKVEYGSILVLDEIDSLEEVNIKSTGTVVSFTKFPEQTIRIKGAFEEIRVKDKNNFYSLHRFGSNPTLPLDNLWGAVVTRTPEISCEGMDALMMKPTGVTDLKIDDDWTHVSLVGDRTLETVEVTGKKVIRSLVVNRGPKLTKLNIRRRALTCSLFKCPNISTIVGFGDRLNIHTKPSKKNSLSIGGFWHQVPEWYDLQVAQLRIPHFNAHLTANDIISCNDLGGVTIIPNNYQGAGGLCQFSDTFDIEIDELVSGIEIPRMIRLIEQVPNGYQVFWDWCSSTLSLFDQYKGMRIIAALISRGFNPEHILKLRNMLSEMNTSMPKLVNGSVNDGDLGGRWNRMYSGDSNEWETPHNSVMPFARLDLEIWLHTDLGLEFLGIDGRASYNHIHPRHLRRRHLGENGMIRNLLITTLSAANTVGRNNMAEIKLSDLAESLYTNPLINTDPFCCEFTVYHLGVSRVATKPIIRALIDGISSMQHDAWKRAALLVGVVDRTNSSRARMALKRLASNKEFTAAESSRINAISISGRKAFGTSKVAKPEWPYLKSWQKEYGE
jgi:hypothetical protein